MNIESFLSADAHWNVNKHLAKQIGILPTILLMELIFCRKKYNQNEFYESVEKLDQILGVGRDARKSAMKVLVEKNLINVIKKGVPARYFYSINFIEIEKLCSTRESENCIASDTGTNTTGESECDTTYIKKEIKNITKNKEEKDAAHSQAKESIKPEDPLFPNASMSEGEIVMNVIQEFLDEHWNLMAIDTHQLRECQLIYGKLREEDKIAQLKRCLILHTYGTIDGQKKTYWSNTPPQPKFLLKNWNDIYSAKIPLWFERGFNSQAEYEADLIKTKPASHSSMDDLKRQFFSGPLMSKEQADNALMELDQLKETINGKN